MSNPYSHFHIIPQENAPEELNLIVEISKGDFNKYEYNKDLGIIELDRVLYGPNHFPVNYCDVPCTWNDSDNDPLDAVVFTTGPLHPGIMVRGRVIGVMEMEDNGEVDHKIICVAKKDPRYDHVTHVDHLQPYERKDMQTFFETYKVAQTGYGSVKVGRFLGPDEAHAIIREAMEVYAQKFGNK